MNFQFDWMLHDQQQSCRVWCWKQNKVIRRMRRENPASKNDILTAMRCAEASANKLHDHSVILTTTILEMSETVIGGQTYLSFAFLRPLVVGCQRWLRRHPKAIWLVGFSWRGILNESHWMEQLYINKRHGRCTTPLYNIRTLRYFFR